MFTEGQAATSKVLLSPASAANTAAATERPKPTKTGSRKATASRVAGKVKLNTSTPTKP